MSIDKAKIWAKARIVKPLTMTYSSDTTKYHAMTIARNMIVEVGEMPESAGNANRWCVYFKRPKGYVICGFVSTDIAKNHLETVKDSESNIQFPSASVQRAISNDVLSVLQNGVSVFGKTLTKVKFDVKLLDTIKKSWF